MASPAALTQEPEPALVDEPAQEILDELETVVIVGGLATPKMWRVTKDDHVMWVLGLSGVPAGARWRTEEMEARIAASQLVLYPGYASAQPDIGVLKLVTLLPTAFKAAKNPDKQTLEDVLPPDTYARWRVLKTKYVGRDNDIERWRPSIALGMLEDKIVDKTRQGKAKSPPRPVPAQGPPLRPLVEQAAKKHKVKARTLRNVERKIEVTKARERLKAVGEMNLLDAACVSQYLDYLEQLAAFRTRPAGAPVEGEAPQRTNDCNEAQAMLKGLRSGEIPDTAGVLQLLDETARQEKLGREQLEAEWLAAAQAAMAKNTSTFAVLHMRHLNSTTSYLARLRELGYTVEEPE